VLACETGLADSAESAVRLASKKPGAFALREVTLASRRSSLKYRGRDVVNQLVKREATGGILVRTRGNVQFFEVDEDMLFLLVAVICSEKEIPYSLFLEGLLRYGLEPQDAGERATLADALERLGMLRRYSDAGESTYVRYVD
jgi:DNA phosphorothioation-dependent restriction protein DptG